MAAVAQFLYIFRQTVTRHVAVRRRSNICIGNCLLGLPVGSTGKPVEPVVTFSGALELPYKFSSVLSPVPVMIHQALCATMNHLYFIVSTGKPVEAKSVSAEAFCCTNVSAGKPTENFSYSNASAGSGKPVEPVLTFSGALELP